MFAFKIVTTVLIALFMLVIIAFMVSQKGEDKSILIGFSAMEIVYIMALIGMWV